MDSLTYKAGHYAPWFAILVSSIPDFEKWLRIASLMVGITLGLYTLYLKFKHRNDTKED